MSITEVVRNYIYISDYHIANNSEILNWIGITHIINCAKEIPDYHNDKFTYLNLGLLDTDDDILKCKSDVVTFIDSIKNGKLLVHCAAGISRSPAIVIMYLMTKLNLCYSHAHSYIKEKRSFINPNHNYVKQLTNSQTNCSQCK